MNCIIIDDEPLALQVIKSYCQDLGGINVVGEFNNPLNAFNILSKEQIDLVFLDIEMPQISGIEFIKAVDEKPLFVFTTAYPQYAIEGFDLNVIDYLVKPIPFSRFIKAINRVKEQHRLKQLAHNVAPSVAPINQLVHNDEFIFVKSDYGSVRIDLKDITYVQGLKDYLQIHLKDAKSVLTLMNFGGIQAKLPEHDFLRVHRSFIVNINCITSVQRSRILIDDIRIPIGDSYKEDFLKRIGM